MAEGPKAAPAGEPPARDGISASPPKIAPPVRPIFYSSRPRRLAACGESFEWGAIVRDLDRLYETEIARQGTRLVLRSDTEGCTGKIFQAVGVALPPTLRQVS